VRAGFVWRVAIKGKPSYLQTLRVEVEPMIEARLFFRFMPDA
jgi:hypothetical protein